MIFNTQKRFLTDSVFYCLAYFHLTDSFFRRELLHYVKAAHNGTQYFKTRYSYFCALDRAEVTLRLYSGCKIFCVEKISIRLSSNCINRHPKYSSLFGSDTYPSAMSRLVLCKCPDKHVYFLCQVRWSSNLQ